MSEFVLLPWPHVLELVREEFYLYTEYIQHSQLDIYLQKNKVEPPPHSMYKKLKMNHS